MGHSRYALILCAAVLGIFPAMSRADDPEVTDAIAREFIVLNANPDEVTDAIGREFVVLSEPADPNEPLDAIGRELVVLSEPADPSGPLDAIAREFVVYNNPVNIADIPDVAKCVGAAYTGPLPVITRGTPPFTWTLQAGPPGMTIDASTGIVSWPEPTIENNPHTITIRATKDEGFDDETWTLTVAQQPVIDDVADTTCKKGVPYVGPTPVLLQGSSPLTWSLVLGPPDMTVNASTGKVTWPEPTDADPTVSVTIRACVTNSTPSCCDEEAWSLGIQPPPIIADIPDATIQEAVPYLVTPTLLRSTGAVTWSLVTGPVGLTINASTGAVTWPSPVGSASSQTITIQVTDDYGNDTETWQLTVPITYTATVSADVDSAPAGSRILLAGATARIGTGEPVPNAQVTIRIRVQGTRRVISAISDEAGAFQALFEPLSAEAGRYQVGADHPSVTTDKTDDEFTLYGMRCSPNEVTLKLIPGQLPDMKQVDLLNLGDTPLTGLEATLEGTVANLSVQTNVPVGLPVYGISWLRYAVIAQDATFEQSTLIIRVTSAEGAVAVLTVHVQVSPLVPRLTASPTSLKAGMLRGAQTLVEFVINNEGGATSEAVEVRVPKVSWLSLATAKSMAPLAPDGKASVVLRLQPDEPLPLGTYNGTIVVSTKLSSVTVAFAFECISDRRGTLRVRVTDEFTYFAEGSPPVAGASVTVKRADTNQVVATGQTDTTGAAEFRDLIEAYHKVEVAAPDHGSASILALVSGGQVKSVETFLPRELVRYSWTVVPINLEDQYRIAVEALFETHVPAPVVAIEPAFVDLTTLGCDAQIDFTVTNHGLIAAKNAKMRFASNEKWEVMPLVDLIGDIPANSSAVVPVRFRRRACLPASAPTVASVFVSAQDTDSQVARGTGNGTARNPTAEAVTTPCVPIRLGIEHSYVCGTEVYRLIAVGFRDPASCVSLVSGGDWPGSSGTSPGSIVYSAPSLSESIPCSCIAESCKPGKLNGGRVSVSATTVRLGESVTFTASGVVDSGGWAPSPVHPCWQFFVQPGNITYDYTVIGPDGEEIHGEGDSVVIVTPVPGAYFCTFSAKTDRRCAPSPMTIGPAQAFAKDCTLQIAPSGDSSAKLCEPVSFHAQGTSGEGRITWAAERGDPPSGEGDSFHTSFASEGRHTVLATWAPASGPICQDGVKVVVNSCCPQDAEADKWGFGPVLDLMCVIPKSKFVAKCAKQLSNNCMNYAFDQRHDAYAQPASIVTCDAIKQFMWEKWHLSPFDDLSQACKANGGCVVALYVREATCPNDPWCHDQIPLRPVCCGDFHWLRRNQDGSWSGKGGDLGVKSTTYDSNVPGTHGIWPLDYKFCSYFTYDCSNPPDFAGDPNTANAPDPNPQDLSTAEAELLVNSGLPNPTLELHRDDETALVREMISQAKDFPAIAPSPSEALGYRGFIVRIHDSDLTSSLTLHVLDGVITIVEQDQPTYYIDVSGLEAFLQDKAEKDLRATFPPHAQPAELPEDEGVCARVRIKIEQQAVISRSGFQATLQLENSGAEALENLGVSLDVRDAANTVATDRFSIGQPALVGIVDLAGSGLLSAGSAAQAVWTFVPDDSAAPAMPTKYQIGGVFFYTVGGRQARIPLLPAEITVLPNPSLHLKYFLEREVYSDDPFTPEVEPAVPFSLGLLMSNSGAGIANNVRITSSQPKIVENEKGLLIDFLIIGTEVGSQSYSPSLTVNLGDLGPGQNAVAQWLMTASLQGKFIEYSATFEHVNGLNSPQLSLIDDVTIHELTHVVRIDQPADDGQPDFLANDLPDADFLPDVIYSSDGTLLPVSAVTEGTVDHAPSLDEPQVELHVTPAAGWIYIRIPDPAGREFHLFTVKRADGSTLRMNDNVWRTYRIRRPKDQPPVVEAYLHLLDNSGSATYTLIHEPLPAPSVADLDQNGTVDGIDWALFLAARGHSQGDPLYRANADLDHDGTVTFVDQQMWIAAYRDFLGDPNAGVPDPIPLPAFVGDMDGDDDVDQNDFGLIQRCFSGAGVKQTQPGCELARLDQDLDVDMVDVTRFVECASGPTIKPPAGCKR